MLRTSRRKKPVQSIDQAELVADGGTDDFDVAVEENDIIIYDSDNNNLESRTRPLRKRIDPPVVVVEKPKVAPIEMPEQQVEEVKGSLDEDESEEDED